MRYLLFFVTVIIGIVVALAATKFITIPLKIILDRIKCIARGDFEQEKLQIINQELSQKNRELESARKELEKKAGELEKSIRYKSEFMANISHELRTPLNGMLILSKDLAANRKKNIHADQVELLEIIHKSGNELLELINDILDFSKIEAGKMTVNIESVRIEDIAGSINPAFGYIANDKGLDLKIHIHEGLPETIWTDPKRLDQIIKNLVGNAIKFTGKGIVSVDFYRPDMKDEIDADLSDSGLDIQKVIAISVSDTGIGVVDDKQVEIFEPFQQADGSTSRKYGGTGLGLSISRSMASLLGGKIHLKSMEGQGSTFTLYLHDTKDSNSLGKIRKPDRNTQTVLQKSIPVKQKIESGKKIWIEDDRKLIAEKDQVILIIEDDLVFAGILARLCHERNFKFIHSIEGEKGLEYIEQYRPDAIILDIQLPGITGWHVLDFLKDAPSTRHIPVLIISIEDRNINALLKGAAGFLTKPVTRKQLEKSFSGLEALITRKIKTVLIIQADDILEKKIEDIIIDQDVNIVSAKTGKDALQKIKSKSFDCVIASLDLSDISVFAMLDKLNEETGIKLPPFIVYEGKEISRENINKLLELNETIVIKYIKTEDGLLDATSLFLHRMTENFSRKNKAAIYRLHDKEKIFKGKKILIVDHNMRNLFAISKLLEDKGACVLKAADGKDGLDILDKDPDADIMLLDVSMPLIDGYEVLEKIRYSRELKNLPVIVMMEETVKNEKDRYILVGANDYLSKPVDTDRLMTLMAFWFEK
ncbi:response regulator [Desulfobacterales bacterium HSG16]|nr:response regulator [Desulfobacterales bacterium HSG16]